MKIYTDRLQDGKEETLDETLNTTDLDINEPELTFPPSIHVQGKATLAGDHLILTLTIKTEVTLPCAICNEPTTVPLKLQNTTHTIPLETIRSHVFDALPTLRELLLLNAPTLAECSGGHCPQRATLKKYLSKSAPDSTPDQFPFSDLN